jgi:3-phosphoshikimate 1-carboxyvinyltransferase
MRRLHIPYQREGFSHFFLPGRARFDRFHYVVPGDFSSAAFPIIAALITQSELTVTHLDFDDTQGDKELIPLLRNRGAKIEQDSGTKRMRIIPSQSLRGGAIDLNPIIDATPILAVLGCFAAGPTRLYNGAVARHKECDRIQTITQELRKMGAVIEEKADGMLISPCPLRGAELESHGDHRIALALSVAALGAEGESSIRCVECIDKSYPEFLHAFQSIGAQIVT